MIWTGISRAAGLNITDLLAGGGTALVWKQEESPFDKEVSKTEQIIVQATDVAVALLHFDDAFVAWAVNIQTGEPVADTTVALHAIEYNYQTSQVLTLAQLLRYTCPDLHRSCQLPALAPQRGVGNAMAFASACAEAVDSHAPAC